MFEAFILGLVQGLGEFLPISSSAHLVIAPWLFGWEDPGLGFDLALHWGTLLAVLFYFRGDIWQLAVGFWRSLFTQTRNFKTDIYQKLAWFIVIASVPGAIIGKLLEEQAESAFRQPLLIAATMFTFGIVLWFFDHLGRKVKTLEHITPAHALIIGISQALAITPGVSRSGSTMTAGLALGFKRADAARFSFLMSIPIIFGAGLANVDSFHQGVTTAQLIIGFVTAAVFGFLSIRFLLRLISHKSFNLFVWYRIIFAVLIVVVYLVRQ